MCGSESKHPETVDGNDADAGNSHETKLCHVIRMLLNEVAFSLAAESGSPARSLYERRDHMPFFSKELPDTSRCERHPRDVSTTSRDCSRGSSLNMTGVS